MTVDKVQNEVTKERFCIVTGMGSHRDSWKFQKTINGVEYVAHDGATQQEFEQAIKLDQAKRDKEAKADKAAKVTEIPKPIPAPASRSSVPVVPTGQVKPQSEEDLT